MQRCTDSAAPLRVRPSEPGRGCNENSQQGEGEGKGGGAEREVLEKGRGSEMA